MDFKLNYEICDGVEKLEKEIARVRKAHQHPKWGVIRVFQPCQILKKLLI